MTEEASCGKQPGRVVEALNGLCTRAVLVKELDKNEQQVRRDLAEMVIKIAPVPAVADEQHRRSLAQHPPPPLVIERFERLADAGAAQSLNDERSGEG